jgi:DNA-directed RNA polymerase I, II, and III subunit RPABC2
MSKTKIIKDYEEIMAEYDPSQNISTRLLSKYEKTAILGMRMEQLARGAQTTVKFDMFDPYEVALKELHERKMPFMICRTLPNGEKEYWRLDDMIIR